MSLTFNNFNFLFTERALKEDETNQYGEKVKELGGNVLNRYLKKINYIIATEDDKQDPPKKLSTAKGWKDTFIIKSDFIKACLNENKIVQIKDYLIFKNENEEKEEKEEKVEVEEIKVNSTKRKINELASDKSTDKNKKKGLSQNQRKMAVDENFPYNSDIEVYQKDSILYDVMLNQTNLGQNNNKFFILQMLYNTKTKDFIVWTRWGRVGAVGQTSQQNCKDFDSALLFFEKKFNAKSGNKWQKLPYKHINGKYFVMERDYEEDEEEGIDPNTGLAAQKAPKKKIGSNLDLRVFDLVKRIFDVKMMNDSMSALSYDTKKMPLGKLTKDHIKKSMQVLKDISNELEKKSPKRQVLVDLSSLFYTIIPHAYGMRPPPVIDNETLLKAKIEMVEALTDIQIANSIMKATESEKEINEVDANYKALKNQINPLKKNGDEFNMIREYVINNCFSNYHAKLPTIIDAFELVRDGEHERFQTFQNLHNRKLLWHGSRMSNFVGILSQGLRIAPPEAPVNGYAYGKGVYFADLFTKSAGYTSSFSTQNEGLMLLCEVALGDEHLAYGCDFHADDKVKKDRKHSTKAPGGLHPDPKSDITLDNGTIVPKGKPIKDPKQTYHFPNEYIVYDTAQIKMKYLIRVQF